MNYYIAEGTAQKGPFPTEQLISQGLRPESLVWREGMAQWIRADLIPELRALFPQAAPPYAAPTAQTYAAPMGAPGYGPGPGQMPPGFGAPQSYTDGVQVFSASEVSNKKSGAGICAIMVGSLGIHKFILGMTTPGLIMLLTTVLTCGVGGIVIHIISIVEGIIYLSKSDAEFFQTYMVQKKQWF